VGGGRAVKTRRGLALIIVVGVVMELIRQVNAQMLAHDYEKLV